MAEIEMTEVKSSSIKSVGYDQEEKELYVRFHTGALYVYNNVPEDVYNELLSAESVGKYFASNVKSNYSYEKVTS